MAKGESYDQFVDKFRQKLTTDDCYTPPGVYDAVADWVASRYHVDRDKMLRPFYPGGDYELAEYPEGSVVVDNPPFSILASIIAFYQQRGIRFFLFAPSLTLFGYRRKGDLVFLPISINVTYTNGAVVRTSFLSNLEPGCILIDQELRNSVQDAADAYADASKITHPKYKMPRNVWNAATMLKIADHGVDIRIPSSDYELIQALDSMRAAKKSIFGSGFIFSDQYADILEAARQQAEAARQQAEAARQQAEAARQITWDLSDRERDIIRRLNGHPRR